MIENGKNDVGPPGVPDRITCPMCGASIAVGTEKCPFCGESLAVKATPRKWRFNLLTLLGLLAIGAVLVAFMLPAVRRSREPARRSQCKNNLKQIALALHNYADDYHAFPPAYTVDAEGKPLHSWRTLILPYLDQRPLYEAIDLSKPWDDPANAEACKTVVPVYLCPSDRGPPHHTVYLACVGPNSCFRLTEPRALSEITDGLSQTLMVIEVPADRAVPWMCPQDADETLLMSIGAESNLVHLGGMQAALCDGSVRFLPATISAPTRRALITVAAGDKVGDF